MLERLRSGSNDKGREKVAALNEKIQDAENDFKAQCDGGNGDATACHSYAEWLSAVDNNYTEAANVYRRNCESNKYFASCFNLGRLMLAGKGAEQSDTEALKLFEHACSNKHAQACHHVGFMNLTGLGTPKDVSKGVAGLKKSCEMEEASSCSRVASIYLQPPTEEGQATITRDPKEARAYLEKACDANFAPACFNLAVMFKNGDDGVAKNDALYEQYKLKTNTLVEQAKNMIGIRTS